MKCKIPEISWHNRDPVLSVDIQPKLNANGCTNGNDSSNALFYRLASGGTDAHVLIWCLNLTADGSDIVLDLAADLTRHQRAVNVVKWSPNGELLASGDDESVIFIWKQKTETDPPNILETISEQDKEVWLTLKVLRGHMEDVYDLSWAPNSQFLLSGSVDNSAIIWDVNRGKAISILGDHKGFVQGVAWDPTNQYLATLSTDRHLRIFDMQTKRVLYRVNKSTFNLPEGHELYGRRIRLFHDDTLQTFFRRLCFTPDGKLLLTPSGVADYDGATRPLHTTYAFSRYALRQPALVLPCPDQYTVAVSCCPLLFQLRPHDAVKNPPIVPLPYRMVFAVATRSSVYFYDTQQSQPFALISNIHYTRLTDVTWSSDGRVVVVSSTDGFCSLITFENGELGEEYEKMKDVLSAVVISETATTTIQTKKSKKQKENDNQESKSRKPSTDDAGTALKPAIIRDPLLENVLAAMNLEKRDKEVDNDEFVENRNFDNENNSDKIKDNLTKDKDINRQEQKVNTSDISNQIVTTTPKTLPVDVILDKEILSSEEKFESPEKKTRAVTPISVRRHPRTPNSGNATPKEEVQPNQATKQKTEKTPRSSIKTPLGKTDSAVSHSSKHATPIAVRRTPRSLINSGPTKIDAPTVIEEAMDAWPLKLPPSPPKGDEKQHQELSAESQQLIAKKPEPVASHEGTCDRTEDIRLVYEDTVEEQMDVDESPSEKIGAISEEVVSIKDTNPVNTNLKEPILTAPVTIAVDSVVLNTPEQAKPQTPNNKTPRRVELRTISTPKSKKKLL